VKHLRLRGDAAEKDVTPDSDNEDDNNEDDNNEEDNNEEDMDINVHNADHDNVPVEQIEDFKLITPDFEKYIARFLLELREKYLVSGTACEFVAQSMHDILEMQQEVMAQDISILRDNNVDVTRLPDLQSSLNTAGEAQKAFNKFSSQKRLNAYFARSDFHVEPIELFLGYDESGRSETYQYVPIRESIKALCQHEDVLSQIINGHQSNDGKIRDFCDGNLHRNNDLFSGDVSTLQIQLYFDDFTVANPLGNKAKNFKISAFYFLLGNLKPKFRSRLHVIQLAILCKAKLIKKYGLTTVMQRVMSDLKALETDGGIETILVFHQAAPKIDLLALSIQAAEQQTRP
jgi:hypothetical protein